MKLRNLAENSKDRLKYLIKGNRIALIVYFAVFLVGVVLGFIFSDSLTKTEWLFYADESNILIIATETAFFGCLFNVFFNNVKTLLCIVALSFNKYTIWGMLVFALLKGVGVAVATVTLVSSFGLMGVAYSLVVLVECVTMVFVIFLCFAWCRKSFCECGILDKYYIKSMGKFYLIMLVVVLGVCLAVTLINFLIVKTIFCLI